MSEIDSSLKSERTLSKSAYLLQQKQRSKFTFRLRCTVFLSVISIYYITFLISAHLEFKDVSTLPYGRKLLHSITTDEDTISTLKPTLASLANCTPSAILAFPTDGLTREQRQDGWILLHVLVALYCFGFLGIICNDYFVPAIEQICLNSKIQKDVIGATFMAAATASPELFMNCVGTFVTKGDIGIGTTIGSAVFNILAVPAFCGLFIDRYVQLDWWPVSRDCLMYCLAVVALIGTLNDGRIMWNEALGLVLCYAFYMVVLFYNDKISLTVRKMMTKCYRSLLPGRIYREVSELTPLVRSNSMSSHLKYTLVNISVSQETLDIAERYAVPINKEERVYANSPWQRCDRCWPEFLIRWPITLLLWLTMPDGRKHTNYKYITLLLSVAWIGIISYIVAFVITVLGDSLNIPDSVMGLTILAAGMSVPDTISSIIVTKEGQGAMGISNAIGSNTFDILLCLGLPWFIKSYFLHANPDEPWVALNSTGFTYSAVLLLATLFGLFVALVANRFVLDWRVGLACAIMYIGFMISASMIELNFFFPVNLPVCWH